MKRVFVVTLATISLLSLLWIWGCASPMPAAVSTQAPAKEAAAPTQAPAAEPSCPQEKAEPLIDVPCAIPDQVVMIGRAEALDAAVGALSSTYPDVQVLRRNSLPGFAMLAERKIPVLSDLPVSQYGELQMWVASTRSPQPVAQSINRDSSQKAGPDRVVAGRNFVLQSPDVAASKWRTDGSPNGPPSLVPTDEDGFLNQWAFQKIKATPKPENGGEGVYVGVLDAFPLDDALQVVQVGDLATFDTPDLCAVDISAHGVFVSSEIEYLAPGVKLLPYRVLDRYGRGSIEVLVRAIDDFTSKVANDPQRAGAVINLSLGIAAGCINPEDEPELAALWKVLPPAYLSNTAIVAAAGNSAAELPDIPARWSSIVLGVGASNSDNKRSCFSNAANVLAPGGEGVNECEPSYAACTAKECLTGVAGRVPDNLSQQGYAYWAGTSFAAPLVTGIAARIMGDNREVLQRALTQGGSFMTPSIQRAVTCVDSPVWGSEHLVDLQSAKDCWRPKGAIFRRLTKSDDNYRFVIDGKALPDGAIVTGVWLLEPAQANVVHWDAKELINPGQQSAAFTGQSPDGEWVVEPDAPGGADPVVVLQIEWMQ